MTIVGASNIFLQSDKSGNTSKDIISKEEGECIDQGDDMEEKLKVEEI